MEGPTTAASTGSSPQCSPGYYGDASKGGACVLCTGHSVGTALRGGPVPGDVVGSVDALMSPTSVALSGSGAVLALGFSDAKNRRRGPCGGCSCVLVERGSLGAEGQ